MNFKMDDGKAKEPAPKPVKVSKRDEKSSLKAVIYYCIKGLYSFVIPEYERDASGEVVIGENGKPKKLFETDANGNNKHEVSIIHKFERFPVIDPKTGKTDALSRIGRFIVEVANPRRDDIIAVIENGRKNKINGILTEDEYKKHSNVEAYRQEQEKKSLVDENTALADENALLREKLAKAGVEF